MTTEPTEKKPALQVLKETRAYIENHWAVGTVWYPSKLDDPEPKVCLLGALAHVVRPDGGFDQDTGVAMKTINKYDGEAAEALAANVPGIFRNKYRIKYEPPLQLLYKYNDSQSRKRHVIRLLDKTIAKLEEANVPS